MEKSKKNSAIEKTEKLAETPTKKSTAKNNNVKTSEVVREENAEKKKNAKLAKQRARKRAERKKLQQREEKKRLALEKREEKRRLALEKKEQRKNAMIERKNAEKQRREDIKRLKLQKKEERLKRRDALKHESKEQRAKRLLIEKNKKLEIKREKLAERARKRQEQAEERRQKRELYAKERRERREKSRGIGGWLAAVISLGCAVLVLGGLLAFTVFTPMDEYLAVSTREQQSFYDLVGYVDAIDVNLSKLVVSKDDENRQKLLGDVRVQSSLATESISSLSIKDEDKYYTTKFINQVNDFSKYLSEKLIDGEKLSSDDISTLKDMLKVNSALRLSLSELASQIDENYDFQSLFEGKEGDIIISKFKELESNAVDYPHMIYDGAFSDGTTAKTAKYIENMQEISKAQAQEEFKKYFSSYGVKDIELVGETTGEIIETYNVEGVDENGVTITAQITKKGGKLVEFNYYKDCNEDVTSIEKSVEIATEFVEKVGYKAIKPVWTADSGNVITVNFASIVDGVICYPDLVKVNVCRERGVVSGLEASSYIYNHVSRTVEKTSVSLSQAKSKVSEEISVETSRLAIIPKGEGKEVLAYEFTGKADGSTYYVYIDAKTGKEVDVFKVIETTEGLLLM